MSERNSMPSPPELVKQRFVHARAIAQAGGVDNAVNAGTLPAYLDTTVSELALLGLLKQNVRKFLCILGHGSTEIGEVLRIYQEAGLLETYQVRHETAGSHAAAALRWVTGEKAAVVTSIGPGALHALAGSLVPASNGLGVWYLLGDITTETEGPNMQQIPKHEQDLFHRLFQTMGQAHMLHTPTAIGTALQRGLITVDHPHRGGPFFLLLPLNVQPQWMPHFNLAELPVGIPSPLPAATDDGAYEQAIDTLLTAKKVVFRLGGGARQAGAQIAELLDVTDGVAILSPLVTGLLPYDHPRNMLVAGSKGTICGNHAMEEADCLVAIGTRFVCQSDSSRTAYPNVKSVIHINTDLCDAMHYNRNISLWGDAAATVEVLLKKLKKRSSKKQSSTWLADCQAKRKEWEEYKAARYQNPTLFDEVWQKTVLTQPAAIKVASDWARANNAVSFFDAGDVQANGFQIVEDDRLGRTFTDTGASYMGFAVSALLATALTDQPFYGLAFSGDGSFTMNPQILIDGVQHGAKGCVLLFDNRRMAAISSLQQAQYGREHATNDQVEVDYVAWAKSIKGVAAFHGGDSVKSLRGALDKAKAHDGLSLIHLPVYFGPDPLGGLGAWGRWNVGSWVDEVQALRHKIGL